MGGNHKKTQGNDVRFYCFRNIFNYLASQRFQIIVVKSCSRSANAHQKQKKSDCVLAGE